VSTYATLTTTLGGRDDGAPGQTGVCSAQDWNSLITAGSFGYDDSGALVGVAGDSPTAEPAGGTAVNSRLSDELYSTGPLDLSGLLNIRFTGDGDQNPDLGDDLDRSVGPPTATLTSTPPTTVRW
jgi:hypothetical protein